MLMVVVVCSSGPEVVLSGVLVVDTSVTSVVSLLVSVVTKSVTAVDSVDDDDGFDVVDGVMNRRSSIATASSMSNPQ